MKRLLLVLGFATILGACGGKDNAPPLHQLATGGIGPSTGGRTHTGGTGTTTETGTEAGGTGTSIGGVTSTGVGGVTSIGGQDAGSNSDAGLPGDLNPIVKMTDPSKDLLSPDEDGVIVDSTFDALCVVQPSTDPSAKPIDKGSVKIELLDADGKVVASQSSVPTSSTSNANEYAARFTLTKSTVTAGRISFRCSAADTATPAHSSQTAVRTYVDFGPDVTFLQPEKDNAAYPLKQSVTFEFQVSKHSLDVNDTKAGVAEVHLQVYDQQNIPLTINDLGNYEAQIDFTTGVFPPELTGVIASLVTATNKRTPKPATASQPRNIILDGAPPSLSFEDPTPKDNEVIGGTRQICFSVTDNTNGSGFKEETITIKLDSKPYKYGEPLPALWQRKATGHYCYQFNSTDFPNSLSQVTIAISAADEAGNTSPQLTRLLYLDNVAPFVSLDPPNIQVITHPSGPDTALCSVPFDSVGADAANTGSVQTASGLVRFRAFVWERTNQVPGQQVVYYSGVDTSNVHIYLRPVPSGSKPVAVEYDNDNSDKLNLCDKIADDLKRNQAGLQTQLDPLKTSQGAADYSTATFPDSFKAYNCQTSPLASPSKLCAQHISDMTYITYMNFVSQANNTVAIYAVNADDSSSSLTCTGSQWNISTAGAIPDGWVCVVAEAADTVGNIGVSAPLPICLDHTNNGTVADAGPPPPCATSTPVTVPNCSIGCKPPSRGLNGDFDKVNNQTVPYDVGNPVSWVIDYK